MREVWGIGASAGSRDRNGHKRIVSNISQTLGWDGGEEAGCRRRGGGGGDVRINEYSQLLWGGDCSVVIYANSM